MLSINLVEAAANDWDWGGGTSDGMIQMSNEVN